MERIKPSTRRIETNIKQTFRRSVPNQNHYDHLNLALSHQPKIIDEKIKRSARRNETKIEQTFKNFQTQSFSCFVRSFVLNPESKRLIN
jgi:hypothetical protein